MKFVLAVHGTRGDVEPCAAVGVELRRRGHAVHMAVPPNLIEFVESAGLTGVAYGPDSDEQINTVAAFVRNLTRAQNPLNLARAVKELFVEGWAEMGTTLTTLADGADLVMTGQTYHGVAANVAEYYDIPAAALHHFPMQVNGQIAIPSIPTPATLVRATIWAGAVQRLKVGSAKRFTNITRGSLLKELRSILAPECAARAREISTRMTRPTAAVTAAADLLEATARQTPGSTPSSSPGR